MGGQFPPHDLVSWLNSARGKPMARSGRDGITAYAGWPRLRLQGKFEPWTSGLVKGISDMCRTHLHGPLIGSAPISPSPSLAGTSEDSGMDGASGPPFAGAI